MLVRADHLHARGRREPERVRGCGAAMISREIEGGPVALAVGVFDALDEVRGRSDRDGDVLHERGRRARLERRDDGVAAFLFLDAEELLARGRIAEEQEGELALLRIIDARHRDLLIARHIEPGVAAVEYEQLLLGL